MTRVLRFLKQVTERYASAICILIAVVTLSVDLATGRDVRFPLLYVIPIGLAAWMGRKTLAYVLSVLLPVVRISFEILWQAPELLPVESVNAAIEVIAMAMYVFLVGRKATETRQMKETITTKDEEMEHLRAFTRLVGTTLQGRGVSPGLADGVAVVYLPEHESALGELNISQDDVESEVNRFDCALEASISELDDIREQCERQQLDDEIALVETRLAMLKSPSFSQKVKRHVREDLFKAEHAVAIEVRHMEEHLKGLKQEYMRERSADVRDLGHQVLRNLRTAGKEPSNRMAALPQGTVLVAEELLLFDALQIDFVNVVAIVTERTSPASHVAILARIRRIPVVCDIKDATSLLASGDHLLVDAETGTVTAAPTQSQVAHFVTRRTQSALFATAAAEEPVQRCVTKDGVDIGLHANIGRPDEAGLVLEHRLDGVGLFRSEFLFLEAELPPDLEAQAAAYSEVAAMLHPRPIIIRTMDLGGDKRPRFDLTANYTASRTSLRGLAYSLAEKTMFRTQILAILRAAQGGNVKIMFPMVMGAAELSEARRLVEEVLESEHLSKLPPIGAMIETPAAAFDIQGILQLADFVSIGTNDLAHFILAIDRGSQGQPGVLSFLHPSVLKATEQIVRAAISQRVAVSVCGEAASDPAIACLLVGMGVKDLSMNPFLAKRVRYAIKRVTIDQAQALAKEALGATTTKEVQETLSSTLHMGDA
jgi:phosphoenolpyruvate-protein phosphotransferase (PTS system enzyme I)